MTKPLVQRINESLDVSGAFDNCFFHTYAIHLMANGLALPNGLFTFKSLLGEESPASVLQKKFQNVDSLSLFKEFSALSKPPIDPDFLVEKSLVLGFLMREWLATQMADSVQIRDTIQANAVEKFITYRDFRQNMDKTDLLSGPEGVLFAANEPFLEYFFARPKNEALSSIEQGFEKYFTEAGGDENNAMKAYWIAEGYQTYCKAIGNPKTKLSHEDVTPVMELLNQSMTIYSPDGSEIKAIGTIEDPQKIEIVLFPQEGHYRLLKTDSTEKLLAQYHQSYEQYKADRESVLSTHGDKVQAANQKSSLLVGAICPSGHLNKEPLALLVEKVDFMAEWISNNQKNARKTKLEPSLLNVNKALETLKNRLNEVVNPNLQEARTKADELLKQLKQYTTEYTQDFNNPYKHSTAEDTFKGKCQAAIQRAKPILEKDLGWGEYLTNLLKAIANTAIKVFSDNPNALFTPSRSALVKRTEEAEEALGLNARA